MSYILVVDDEPQICELLTRWLTVLDHRVKGVLSATSALEAMLAEPADILFCDVKMPGRSGLWLVERVRARWPDTAVIMASGVDDLQTVEKSRALGAVDYITKPFSSQLLRQALDRAATARRPEGAPDSSISG